MGRFILVVLVLLIIIAVVAPGCSGGKEQTPRSTPGSIVETPAAKPAANFKLTNLRAVQSKPGVNSFDITIDIQNVGNSSGTCELVSKVDGKDVGSDRITLEAGQKMTVPLIAAATKLMLLDLEAAYAGRSTKGETHVVSVGDISTTVTFEDTKGTSVMPWPTPTVVPAIIPTQTRPTATPSSEGWADMTTMGWVLGSSSTPFYVVGNATIYFSFEAAGQSVAVTVSNKVWAQPVAPENVPAAYMSKLKGGTIVGVKLTAPEGYGYDVTFGYNKIPIGVVVTGDIREGAYRPVGLPRPDPASQSTAIIYSASPSTTATPGATPTASPTPVLTKTPSPTATPTTTQPAKGLPDLVISDVWLTGQGRGFTTPCGNKSKNTGGIYVRIEGNVMDGSQYEDFQVSYTVKNIGTAPIPAGYAGSLNAGTAVWIDNKFVSDSNWIYVPDNNNTGLGPGETTSNTVPINLRFYDFTPGAHTVTLRANTEIATDGSAKNLKQESNYDNNQVILTFTRVACQK